MTLTVDAVRSRTFTTTKWREGYAADEVDAFLDRVADALQQVHVGRPTTLTAEEVVAVRFAPTKFRTGYDQDEVDDFLDEVVLTLRGDG